MLRPIGSDDDEEDDPAPTPDAVAAVHTPAPASPEVERLADILAELDEHEEQLAICDNHADLYCRHLLRKALSSTITIELLELLKMNSRRMHLIVDYKQKVMPESARETQTECFGKRGKSLHGCTALRWDTKTQDFSVLNVRVACDDANQTWFHTLNGVKMSLDAIKEAWDDIDESSMQSDGAGNYDCTAFMLSLERLFAAADMRLVRHVISEVGDGKNLQDTDFQQAQMSLNHGKDGGRSFADAQGIIDTLEETKTLGVVNIGMELGGRELEPKGKEGPKSYKGIDGMYDRVRRCATHHLPRTARHAPLFLQEYVYDGKIFVGVCMRKFFGLGEGRLVRASALQGLWRKPFDAAQVKPVIHAAGSREAECPRTQVEAISRAQPRAFYCQAQASAFERAAGRRRD